MKPNNLTSYVLHHSNCDVCVWGENGFYNPICCHCKYINFAKRDEPSFMTRQMAEALGLVKPKV